MSRKSDRAHIDASVAGLANIDAAVGLVNRTTGSWRRELHKRAKASRYLFRGSGVVVLLLSASLPVIAASSYYSDRLLVAAIGSAIGTLSALTTFYRWGDRWRIYRRAELEMEYLLRQWEADIIEGSLLYEPDSPERTANVVQKTQTLISRTKEIVENQHLAFFEALQLTLPKVAAMIEEMHKNSPS